MKSERFTKALEVVLKHEGAFCNNKDDPGGATNMGVSLRLLKTAGMDIDLDGSIDIQDIKKLTPKNAAEIYHRLWWERYRYDKIYNLGVAIKIFDLAVNMGAMQAHKLIQRAINALGTSTVKVDGIFGMGTIQALNFIDSVGLSIQLIDTIRNEGGKFYTGLVNKNPKLKVFYKGWMNRLND